MAEMRFSFQKKADIIIYYDRSEAAPDTARDKKRMRQTSDT